MLKKFIEYEVEISGKYLCPIVLKKKIIAGSVDQAIKFTRKDIKTNLDSFTQKINIKDGKLSKICIEAVKPII